MLLSLETHRQLSSLIVRSAYSIGGRGKVDLHIYRIAVVLEKCVHYHESLLSARL